MKEMVKLTYNAYSMFLWCSLKTKFLENFIGIKVHVKRIDMSSTISKRYIKVEKNFEMRKLGYIN